MKPKIFSLKFGINMGNRFLLIQSENICEFQRSNNELQIYKIACHEK